MAEVSRNAELMLARIASKDPEFTAAAQEVAATARALAPQKTGDFKRSIKRRRVTTQQGVHDQLITTDDPDAAAIELGHITPSGKFVPGHHTFGKTAAKYR
jgi:bacteriophage protein of unknown function (DUF646)|nr:MAG TPA: type I neck protein [Caudoviricetes sp.]